MLLNFLNLFLVAIRATAKEIDIARSYIAKDIGADNNIGCYWKAGIGTGYSHGLILFNRARLIPKSNIHYLC